MSVPAVFAPVLLGGRACGFESLRGAGDADMVQDLGNGAGVLDEGDDLAPAAAFVAFKNINKKRPFKEFCPAHSALLVLLRRVWAGCLLTLGGVDDHLVSPASLGGKLSVVAQQISPRDWYKC